MDAGAAVRSEQELGGTGQMVFDRHHIPGDSDHAAIERTKLVRHFAGPEIQSIEQHPPNPLGDLFGRVRVAPFAASDPPAPNRRGERSREASARPSQKMSRMENENSSSSSAGTLTPTVNDSVAMFPGCQQEGSASNPSVGRGASRSGRDDCATESGRRRAATQSGRRCRSGDRSPEPQSSEHAVNLACHGSRDGQSTTGQRTGLDRESGGGIPGFRCHLVRSR